MRMSILESTSFMLLLAAAVPVVLVARGENDPPPAKAKQPAEEAGAKAKAAMLDAAQKTHEAVNAGYDAGTATAPEVYAWSLRWAGAERKLAKTKRDEIAALMAHWRRMANLHAKIEALWRAGARGGENEKYYAAKYYLAEAELMLTEAGVLQPKQAD
ncbi:MAG TPA: hypothetical protein VMV10_15445 [Pirellulales bacterium]|nr:hypothetical protein [Pirellulales bacterium]